MTPEYEAAKEWLRRFKYIQEDLRALSLRIETLRDMALSPAAPVISGMPRSGSRDNDRIGKQCSVIDLLEREMSDLQDEAAKIYYEIDSAIKTISGKGNADRRLVLQLRYLDLLPWDSICFAVFGGKADFNDREQSYSRRCLDLHKQGILSLMEIIDFGIEKDTE